MSVSAVRRASGIADSRFASLACTLMIIPRNTGTPHHSSRATPVDPKLEIIVVDDDDDGRVVITFFLHKSFPHARVSTFSNAEEALIAIEGRRPQAIVTDYVLPAMRGIDFVKAVRTRDADVPIVMLSGMDSVADEALAAGVNVFLPTSATKELGEVLQRLI